MPGTAKGIIGEDSEVLAPGINQNISNNNNNDDLQFNTSSTISFSSLAAGVRNLDVGGRLSSVRDYLGAQNAKVVPWRQFIARPSVPATAGEATRRIWHNLGVYRPNYVLLVSLIGIYAVITSPALIFSLVVLATGMYVGRSRQERPIVLPGGRTVSGTEILAITAALTLPLLWFAAAGSVVFWFVGASAVFVTAHGALMPVQGANAMAAAPGLEEIVEA